MSELEKYKDHKTILAVIASLRSNSKFLLLKRAEVKRLIRMFTPVSEERLNRESHFWKPLLEKLKRKPV